MELTISTVIPRMRKIKNVEANAATSDGKGLDTTLMDQLRKHRWVRIATKEWAP